MTFGYEKRWSNHFLQCKTLKSFSEIPQMGIGISYSTYFKENIHKIFWGYLLLLVWNAVVHVGWKCYGLTNEYKKLEGTDMLLKKIFLDLWWVAYWLEGLPSLKLTLEKNVRRIFWRCLLLANWEKYWLVM